MIKYLKLFNYSIIIFFILFFLILSSKAYTNNIKNSAVIFMYHRFGESAYPSTNITLQQFEEHLKEFSKEKYNVVSLEYIIDAFNTDTKLPENTIAITVDDGYKSVLVEAWPRLKKLGFPLTLFISTEPIDAKIKGYLSWDEVRKLKSEGVIIGAHTRTHPHLHELTLEKIQGEIEYSNKRYLSEINEVPKLFAYPFGEASKDVIDILKDYKFKAAFGQHSGVVNETSDFNYLPRFSLNEQYGNIERVIFTANSKGLGIYEFIPYDPLLKENPPFIGFSLLDKNLSAGIKCFVFDSNGSVETEIYKFGERIEIRLKRKLKTGRVRVNCTVKDQSHWRWYGKQFILPNYLD